MKASEQIRRFVAEYTGGKRKVYTTTSMRKATWLLYHERELIGAPISPNGQTLFVFCDADDGARESIHAMDDPCSTVNHIGYTLAEDDVRAMVSANRAAAVTK
jgi:hypothetical protein